MCRDRGTCSLPCLRRAIADTCRVFTTCRRASLQCRCRLPCGCCCRAWVVSPRSVGSSRNTHIHIYVREKRGRRLLESHRAFSCLTCRDFETQRSYECVAPILSSSIDTLSRCC